MKTIVFDIKAVTNHSGQLTSEMLTSLSKLTQNNNVVIFTEFSWKNIVKTIINKLSEAKSLVLNNLYFITSSGACLYQFWTRYGWVPVYQLKLTKSETDLITKTVEQVLSKINSVTFTGKQIDVSENNVLVSVIGNKASYNECQSWDVDWSKKSRLVSLLKDALVNYEVFAVNNSMVNVALKNVNQKYGIDELMKHLHVSKDDVVCVAPDVVKDGFNYFAIEMGLEYVNIQTVEDVSKYIESVS
jgi:hydroxymethylpyrimidine pyrophosphatase-like HAD family hydrolase